MPLIESTYSPPLGFSNGHVQSLFSTLFRRVPGIHYQRERIDTPDGDFLDLDWSRIGSKRLAILSHGLEGTSERSYIRGMARALNRRGWDALAWNYRSCSGEINRTLRLYHMGATEDLDTVIGHVLALDRYQSIDLVGFSMGGNLSLKYLGERNSQVSKVIRKAIAFSVPCNLKASAAYFARPACKIYMKRFIKMFHEKVRAKMKLFPGKIDDLPFKTMKTFREWDDYYTAPLHGFRDAEDYWQQCSSERYLEGITLPTLLVNAGNDPFLPKECYPIEIARRHPHFSLEVPKSGGHVGFVAFGKQGEYWSEQRALDFLAE